MKILKAMSAIAQIEARVREVLESGIYSESNVLIDERDWHKDVWTLDEYSIQLDDYSYKDYDGNVTHIGSFCVGVDEEILDTLRRLETLGTIDLRDI